MTSKERVLSTLNFTNTQDRVPRQLWSLPWANEHCSEMMEQLARDFEWDFDGPDTVLKEPPTTKGDAYTVGEYVDEWGCVFTNIHRGVIGEVKKPIVEDEEWNDVEKVHIPEELLTFDIDQVNRSCERKQDKFLFASCSPRPFEQLEFIRGTANFYMDLMDPSPKMLEFMKRMHDFYSRLMEKWAKTDVDALNMMDDWGSQKDLLIAVVLTPDLPLHPKEVLSTASYSAWDWKIWSSLGERLHSGERSTDSICCRKVRRQTSIAQLRRYIKRFGKTAAVLHSASSDREQNRKMSIRYLRPGKTSETDKPIGKR